MPVNHDIWDAVPPNGGLPVDKTKLRNTVTVRMPYVLADDDNPAELIAVDPVTGAAIIDINFKGLIFHYDPTDKVTEGDNVTVIVSSEGRRYKLTDAVDVIAYSVLDNATTAPPVDAELGDAYLIPSGATGDWAGMENRVGVLTARGWVFIIFGIGRAVYVESLEAYFHRKSTGEWVVGLGNLTIGTQSVPLSSTINFGNRIIVENQTTTAPPGIATVGTAYIIGASATGTWAGKDLKVAICEVANTFTVYTPSPGWSIYDKATASAYTWNGTAWLSTAGTWIDRKATPLTASGSTTAPVGTTLYVFSLTTAPTTAQRRLIDTVTLAYSAKKASATLQFEYHGSITKTLGGSQPVTDSPLTIALFRDSGSTAIAWAPVSGGNDASTLSSPVSAKFEVTSPDSSNHTYTIAILSGAVAASNVYLDATNFGLRRFTVQEAA